MFDVAMLSRFQFAFTVAYHFLFVPMSIGLGLIMALAQTRYYKTRTPEDLAGAKFWVKVFTITFAIGVATGITMEFAFGTNWADYSRFVGDIFGAPLAAEALLAFFLESSFLGVILFAREKVSAKFYMVSAWLVWAGSCLSALWILIANSWMQTPAGYEVEQTAEGAKAVLTNFWAAALNPSIGPRYFHTVIALLIFGAFVAIAIGAYHMLHEKKEFGKKTVVTGTIVAIVAVIAMIPAMHAQAVEVAAYQPEKLVAMEAQYETGPADMYLVGFVDENNQKVIGISVPIPGMTSFLATNDFTTQYAGLNEYPQGETAPVQITFQAYHLMVALFGFIGIWLILSLVATLKIRKGNEPPRGLLKAMLWGPLFPIVAIQAGWMVTEIGRQPWIVWHLLRTDDAISQAVDSTELLITILLFVVIYAFMLVMYIRIVMRTIKEGPVLEDGTKGASMRGAKKVEGAAKAAVDAAKDADAKAPGNGAAEGEVK